MLPVWTSCLAFLQRLEMEEHRRTQVQTPASVRDSPKPWLSPDRFRLVNLILCGAPVSEPIRDVYKCYQHLHIITYSSTSAPNIDANMQEWGFFSFLWSCSFLKLLSICPMADGKKENPQTKFWNISGFPLWICVSLWEDNKLIERGFLGKEKQTPNWISNHPSGCQLTSMEI